MVSGARRRLSVALRSALDAFRSGNKAVGLVLSGLVTKHSADDIVRVAG